MTLASEKGQFKQPWTREQELWHTSPGPTHRQRDTLVYKLCTAVGT